MVAYHCSNFALSSPPRTLLGDPSSLLLTSVWSFPGTCSQQWKLSSITTAAAWHFDDDGTTATPLVQTFDFIVYSTIPRSTQAAGTTELYDYRDVNCQPRTFQSYYSPGVCPEQHTVAEMTVYNISTTSYIASCCRRSVYILPPAYT
jgi:hypothetical protein